MIQASAIGRIWLAIWVLVACALAAPVAAQSRQSDGNIALSLVADGKPRAGETWTVALRFTPRSGEWHGYWSNPGDAGAPMRLEWDLPEGWRAGEPQYPVPQLLTISGLANHIFEGTYTVLVPIEVPRNLPTEGLPRIGLEADYLACTDRICVPQRAQVTLDADGAEADARFAEWRSRIAPDLDRPATMAAVDRTVRVAIPLPASLQLGDPHVFVETPDAVDYAAPQTFARDGNRLIATLALEDGASPPAQLTGILALGGGEGVRFTADPGSVPTGGEPLAGSAGALPTVWAALLLAFLGGLVLNVMPCVFPILSLKALALAKAGGAESAARRDALAYTGGVMAATLALGALLLVLRAGGEQIGWAFQLQEPGVVVALMVLAAALTANFLGLFEIPGMAISGTGASRSGSFATGLLAAFVATPCTSPFMAAALGAALILPVAEALALFAALGLGLAFPFLLLGFVPPLRAWLPRPGPWMDRFRRWMALPMGLTALALAWLVWRLGGPVFLVLSLVLAAVAVAMLVLVWSGNAGRQQKGRLPVLACLAVALVTVVVLPFVFDARSKVTDTGLLATRAFSEDALLSARQEGPVFVYFTADWCLTCKVNESAAIERETTRDAFDKADVTVLRGDWTTRDADITRFLTRHGAAGVPLYLWYPRGQSAPRQLPQVLTPGLLAGLARGSAAPVLSVADPG